MSDGIGRTTRMIAEAVERAALGQTTLILTPTESEAVRIRKLVGPVAGVAVRAADRSGIGFRYHRVEFDNYCDEMTPAPNFAEIRARYQYVKPLEAPK